MARAARCFTTADARPRGGLRRTAGIIAVRKDCAVTRGVATGTRDVFGRSAERSSCLGERHFSRPRSIDVPRVEDLGGNDVTLVASHGTRARRTQDVGLMRTDAAHCRARSSGGVHGGGGIHRAMTSRAVRRHDDVHVSIDVAHRVGDRPIVGSNDRAVASRAFSHLWMWRSRWITVTRRARESRSRGPFRGSRVSLGSRTVTPSIRART